MASRSSFLRLFAYRATTPQRTNICMQCRIRYSSTTTTAPSPTLSRLREDLKTAMRAKDTVRLNVLRAILADITNASKTSSPITDDLSLLTLIKKKISQTETSIADFNEQGRKDLVEKEQSQLDVLNDYAGSVQVMGKEDIREAVKQTVEEIKSEGGKVALGEVMKRVTAEGRLGGQAEKKTIVSVIREELGDGK